MKRKKKRDSNEKEKYIQRLRTKKRERENWHNKEKMRGTENKENQRGRESKENEINTYPYRRTGFK